MQLLSALRNAARRLAADFQDSSLFSHRGDRGEFREFIIEKFLRPFLPPCYGLGSGQVFSTDGTSSKQIDIVIYDAVFSNVLFRDARNSLFPCESIYGTIEVKSSLSVEELTTSIDNIKSVKTLSRAESDMLDFLPQRRLSVGGGLTYSQTRRNPYLGVVFAYDGIRGDTVAEFLNQRLQDNPILADLLPDFVFCYSKGYMILRLNGNKLRGVAAPFGGSYNMFGSLDIGPDTLPLFYLTLNVCLNNIQLRGTDLNPYWIQVVNEAEAQRKVPDHAS